MPTTRLRIRSRAYEGTLQEYTESELVAVHRYAVARCSEWMIARPKATEQSAKVYLRFDSLVSISTIQDICERMEVKTTTLSFKNTRREYIRQNLMIESNQMPVAKRQPAPTASAIAANQSLITAIVDNKPAPYGKVAWVNFVDMNDMYNQITSMLNARKDVFVVRYDPPDVRRLVYEELVSSKRIRIKAIVLLPEDDTNFQRYLGLVNELRSGCILDPRIGGNFKPLNVVVFSRKYLADTFGDEHLPLEIENIVI